MTLCVKNISKDLTFHFALWFSVWGEFGYTASIWNGGLVS